jgi:hypothetical protein
MRCTCACAASGALSVADLEFESRPQQLPTGFKLILWAGYCCYPSLVVDNALRPLFGRPSAHPWGLSPWPTERILRCVYMPARSSSWIKSLLCKMHAALLLDVQVRPRSNVFLDHVVPMKFDSRLPTVAFVAQTFTNIRHSPSLLRRRVAGIMPPESSCQWSWAMKCRAR